MCDVAVGVSDLVYYAIVIGADGALVALRSTVGTGKRALHVLIGQQWII